MVKVSVIIPIYNRENWVENLIKNLKAQTLKDIEFLIVDDASIDATYKKIINNTQEDSRFVIIKSANNEGPSHARNLGLEKAKGEYIGFFDSDDNIPPNYFENLYKQAHNAHADIIYTSYNNISHAQEEISREEDKMRVLKNGAVWDKLFKREYLNKNHIKFTEGLYTADNLFVLQAFLQTNNIILVSEPSYEYNIQEDSIEKDVEKQQKRKQDIIKVLQKAMELSEKHIHTQEMKEEFLLFLQRSLNGYQKDKNFQKQFYQTLGIKKNKKRKKTIKQKVLNFFKKVINKISTKFI